MANRRLFETVATVLVTGVALIGLASPSVFAPAGALLPIVSPARAQGANVSELMVAGPLGDVALGSPDAKVTVIEYASLTCSHCATFHERTLPAFKAKYVDTGKVRFILRDFPLDPLAVAGTMLARCAGPERYHAMTDLLFQTQKTWAYAPKPVDALLSTVRQAGFTQESFETCLKDQKIYDGVLAVKNRAVDTFAVNSTPTFFVNGQRQTGALSMEELDRILTPLVSN